MSQGVRPSTPRSDAEAPATADAGLVRLHGQLVHVHQADALHWVTRCVCPALLMVGTFASAEAAQIRRGAGALLSADSVSTMQCGEREVQAILRPVRLAREALIRDAVHVAARLEQQRTAVRFLVECGSVSRMLETHFPTLVDATAAVRHLAGAGAVATEAYRAAAAAICQSMLASQLCMNRKLIPARLHEAYRNSVSLLEARCNGIGRFTGGCRVALGAAGGGARV